MSAAGDDLKGTVLVTGAAGFVGRAACRALLAQGFRVRAGVRQGRLPADLAARSGLEQVPCDLARPEQVQAATIGADAVVHAAYGENTGMERDLKRVLEACDRENIRRLVHLSTIAVYGDRSGVVTENDAPMGPLSAYPAAKLACEQLLMDWAREGRSAVMLRIGIIYGTGSTFWIDKLARRITSGGWGTFGEDGEGLAALVHVDDVARAIALAVKAELGEGAPALNITGPEAPSWNAYFLALAKRLGVTLRAMPPSERLLRSKASLGAKVWRRLHLPGLEALALAPTEDEMKIFALKARYPSDAARALIGWQAAITLDEGLAMTRFPGEDHPPSVRP